MTQKSPIQTLPQPPSEYAKPYFEQLARALNQLILNVANPGDLVCSSLMFITWPKSGYGLRPGMVWVDEDKKLTIVTEDDVFGPSFGIKLKLGTVTATAV